MSELIKVGMADYKTGRDPDKLITYGLGSCVGIALYDNSTKIGGLAHIMLPSSREMSQTQNIAKFADTCLHAILEDLIKLGVRKERLTAKIAGGSQMFLFNTTSEVMRIGDKNVLATKEVLKSVNIKILAEDTGGNYGRTVELDLSSGEFNIRTIKRGQNSL